jgi:hypothetical protein
MGKDNNIPLCYQITVSNITKIGDRVMSVIILSYRIFISFSNLLKKIKILGSHQLFMEDSPKIIQVSLGTS